MTRYGGFSLGGTFQSSLQQQQLHTTTTHSLSLPRVFIKHLVLHDLMSLPRGSLSTAVQHVVMPKHHHLYMYYILPLFFFGALLTYFASQKSRILEKIDMEELASEKEKSNEILQVEDFDGA